jgi:lysophospholipase L1-like esterase
VVNRGFGGSHFSDAVHFVDRILAGHQPRIIVVYEGDNDIAAGKSPEQVANDFRDLVARIRKLLPSTRLVVVSIKPSPARWQYFQAMQEANRLIRAEVERPENLDWADVVPPMLGSDGRPCRAFFRDDCLHLNESGYRLWTEVIGCSIRRHL